MPGRLAVWALGIVLAGGVVMLAGFAITYVMWILAGDGLSVELQSLRSGAPLLASLLSAPLLLVGSVLAIVSLLRKGGWRALTALILGVLLSVPIGALFVATVSMTLAGNPPL